MPVLPRPAYASLATFVLRLVFFFGRLFPSRPLVPVTAQQSLEPDREARRQGNEKKTNDEGLRRAGTPTAKRREN